MAAFLADTCLPGIGVTRAFFAIEVYFLVAGMVSEARSGILVFMVDTGGFFIVPLAFVTATCFEGDCLF